jgi:predicted Zn-dependent peptidase
MITSTVLSNGVRIISETMAGVRSVSLGVWVNVGSRNDPPKNRGIAHFTEHMMFKGTQKRSAMQIAKEIDALGGHLNAQTAKEYTVYYTKVLDEHLIKAADILFDLFLNAEINPDELEKEKNVVLQEIHMTEDTPDDYINDLFAEAFFHDTTLGSSILGTRDHVGAFKRGHIMDFLSSSYTPEDIIVAGSGSIQHQTLVDFAAPLFERLSSKKRLNSENIRLPIGRGKKIYAKDIEQVHLTVGATGSAMNDERRWTYIVLNTMFGGSMSSMLFQEAREELGLVYSIYSYLSAYHDCGVLAIYAASSPENVNKTLDVIGKQMTRLKKGQLSDIKLDDIKAQIKGNILLSRESTVNTMSSMAKNEMYYGREVTVDEVIEKIKAVSLDDIVELANDIFVNEELTFVTLGRISKDSLEWSPLP